MTAPNPPHDVPTRPPFEAYQGQDPYIFVSYAHKDAAAVFGELERLRAMGCRVWYDEGIDPGNEITELYEANNTVELPAG